jgi:hypothetical protein
MDGQGLRVAGDGAGHWYLTNHCLGRKWIGYEYETLALHHHNLVCRIYRL